MLDLNRTFTLIKGAMFDPDKTWDDYLPEADDWKTTAFLITGPLIIGGGLFGYLLKLIFPSKIPFMPNPSFLGMLVGIVIGAAAAALIAFIVSFLAGQFKGKQSFPKALAATSLAFVPGYVGQILSAIPFIGWLMGLALSIYSLILLWRILPKYMEVPETSRAGHYILSVVGAVVGFLILGFVAGGFGASRYIDGGGIASRDLDKSGSGMFGSIERTGRIVDSAESDEYDPPSDGELSKSQVKAYITAMQKTKELVKSQTKDLKELSERADNEDIESIGEIFSGLGNVMSMSTAEMEVVKTGGGNWAEHQWVKEQLRVAMIQRDINKTVKHNYELYQEYEDELRDFD